MKRILSLSAIGILLLFSSCNNEKTEKTSEEAMPEGKKEVSMAEKNIAASRVIDEAFRTGDVSKIDDVIASDFVDHTDRGDKNRDSLKVMIVLVHSAFPDMKTEIIKELADNEYLFSLTHWSGNSNGQMGMPKGPFDMRAIEVTRFKDGKGVEHWTYMQPEDVIKMMAPPPPAKTNNKK